MKIKDSTVLVTGANRGIGKAYAEAFRAHGARKIYLGSRNPENVKDMVAEHPDVYVPLELDVTNPAHIAAAAKQAVDVQILVNNAGILFMEDGLTDPKAAENAREQFEVNYIGPLLMTQAFAPVLKKNGGGTLAIVSSIAGHVVFPALPTYTASKFAANAFIQSARQHLTAQGTHVVGVYPGPIDTDMGKAVDMEKFPPSLVAEKTIAAIEKNELSVFPDDASQGLYAALKADPEALEQQMVDTALEEAA